MDDSVRLAVELELPRGEHRDRLLDALANLIRRRGYESFVSAPILLPRAEYFPERWEHSVVGARRLLRRLMHYAGLGEFDVKLESWRERPALGSGLSLAHTGDNTAAWFAGFSEGACQFGLELEQLRHEESLVATLAHEVAHAYRNHHGLVIRDRDLEEKLTDLTCVYLGFGLFSLNASHVVKTGGVSSAGEKLLYETHSLGYLAPSEFALLLGAQLAVRADRAEQQSVCEELSANHAALVRDALRRFAGEAAPLRERLAVPEPASWPARDDARQLAPLHETDDEDSEPELAARAPEHLQDEIVFRVKGNRALSLGTLTFGGCAVAGTWLGLGTSAFYGLCAAGAAAGGILGQRLRADECSGCRARLTPHDERCRKCGGQVAGDIARRGDRLEAEEQYRASHAARSIEEEQDEDEDPVTVLFTAMLAAWALSRGFLADDASDEQRALQSRVRELEFDTEALYDAWLGGLTLDERAARFATYYCGDPESPSARDFEILSTANRLDARVANYQRFGVILDRRFAEWQAAADLHAQKS